MKKLAALLLGSSMVVASVGGSISVSAMDASEVKVAIVCDASGQNDNGYNQSAVEGAQECADSLGIEYKVVEPTESIGDTLAILAEDGYNLIFSMEYDFDALINGEAGALPIAEQYPDTTFVVFNDTPNQDEDGNTIHDNVISILYNVNESSYLAGALSVLVNENSDVLLGENYSLTSTDEARALGFIGATDSNGITVFGVGFVEGAQYVAEELDVTYDYYAKYDAGFSDTAGGSTVAGTYFDNGANVVYAVAGSVGDGVASKAKEVQKLAIHVDANKDSQQPGYILTSVIKNTKVVVETLTEAMIDGSLADMDLIQVYDLSSGATSITDMAEFSAAIEQTDEAQETWQEILDYLDDLSAQIGDGTIVVTNMQNGDSFDESTCPNINFK
ncbi:MAG: BMP family ABC transporter substrate-binding protein [Lachnospiraceae bacterium]|nr:BMP family ABC transporter substrate-binding protein [Lachnospiraceae bacterium]